MSKAATNRASATLSALLLFLTVGDSLACEKTISSITVRETSFKEVPLLLSARSLDFMREEGNKMVNYSARCVAGKAAADSKEQTTCETWCIQPKEEWDKVRGDSIGGEFPEYCKYNFKKENAFELKIDDKIVGRIKIDKDGGLVIHSVKKEGNDMPADENAGVFRVEQRLQRVATSNPASKGNFSQTMEGFRYKTGKDFSTGKANQPLEVQYDSYDPSSDFQSDSGKSREKYTPPTPDVAVDMEKNSACRTGDCQKSCGKLEDYMKARLDRLKVQPDPTIPDSTSTPYVTRNKIGD